MWANVSIFLDFNLPNATTWFYFSFLLSVALFFKFARVLSMRNWDVVTLFLLVPGLMLVQGPRLQPQPLPHHPAVRLAALIGQGSAGMLPAGPTTVGDVGFFTTTAPISPSWVWIGYLWLMVGSAYVFCRCLFDLALVQRPALAPNLTFGGLAWLAMALVACLTAVAFRPNPAEPFATPKVENVQPSKPVGPETATLAKAREWIEPRWWLARSAAVLCHLAVVVGLVLLGRRHFQDPAAGMAAAAFYLILPYTGLYIGQVHHVLPTAVMVWALVVFPWPLLAGLLMGLASGIAYFPALLVPLWTSFYWRRGAGRFLVATLLAAGLTLAATGLSLWMDGTLEKTLSDVTREGAWQPWKPSTSGLMPSTESFWTGDHRAYRLPVFIAYAAFWLVMPFWPMPKNLAHLIALSTALLVGIQFWYADQGGVYVLWYLPLLLLLVFRPNLAERRPPEINSETDWWGRAKRGMRRFVSRLLRTPEPAGSK
jgi:hypothetical protein